MVQQGRAGMQYQPLFSLTLKQHCKNQMYSSIVLYSVQQVVCQANKLETTASHGCPRFMNTFLLL